MKKLILILMLVLLPVFAFANPTPTANVTFAWDANTDTVTGYRLYQRSEFGSYTYGEGNEVGTTLAGTEIVTIQVKDGKWYWVVTA